MKKVLLTIAVVLTMGLCANAQDGKDNFFGGWENMDNRDLAFPELPVIHGYTDDLDAPLSGGLLVLTVLGAGYAIRKKNEK